MTRLCVMGVFLMTIASGETLAHVSNSFTFTVHAPVQRAALLFGPNGERNWAGEHWDPQFLYPVPAQDVEGAVFTIQHGPHKVVWVNTLFDMEHGRMQYVYFMPDRLATTINVRLQPVDSGNTRVDVTYIRTALQPDANEQVWEMGEHDKASADEWANSINHYLQKQR